MRKRLHAGPPVLMPALGWRAGPWAARSLAEGGYTVLAGAEHGRVASGTRDCAELVWHPAAASDPDAFLECIEAVCRERGVAAVVPIDDETLQLLAAQLPSPGGAKLVGPTLEQYDRICDKGSLAEAAVAAGFATPARAMVEDGEPQGEWPRLPSIVKPLSARITGDQPVVARKPVIVRDADERSAAVASFVELCGGSALVEEQVQGDAWRVHFVRSNSFFYLLTFRSLRNYPPGTGQSSKLRVVPAPAELTTASRRLLDQAAYLGLGSIQAIERDGRFFVHDVNLRLPVTLGATLAAGFDMPRLAVDSALGRPTPWAEIDQATPRTYISLYAEALHVVDGLRGRPTGAPVARIVADVLHALVSPKAVLDPISLGDPHAIGRGFAEVFRRLRSDEVRSRAYAQSPVAGRPAWTSSNPSSQAERVGGGAR